MAEEVQDKKEIEPKDKKEIEPMVLIKFQPSGMAECKFAGKWSGLMLHQAQRALVRDYRRHQAQSRT